MPGLRTSSSSEVSAIGLALISWDDTSPTGGNVVHERLVTGLRELGIDARIVRVGAGWPEASVDDRRRLAAALRDHPVALVDGIVAGNAPHELAAAPGRVGVLVHLPLASEQGISLDRARRYRASERAALAAADVVLCPSRFVARELAESYGRADAIVAEPGADLAPVATGSTPPHLLWLGALTASKDPLRFVEALKGLTDLEWTATIVGPARDPDVGARVRSAATASGGRVTVAGPLVGAELDGEWARSDLLVSTSVVETYGLVVAEALAHGIPALVPAGTGAVEALGEVDGLPPGRAADPAELVPELRRWLSEPERRGQWRERALRRRARLPTWDATARVVRDALLIGDGSSGG